MKNRIFSVVILVMALSSCSSLTGFKQSVGISRDAPDEFMVMPREKLVLPNQAIGLPEPTEKAEGNVAASDNARKAVYGESAPAQPKSALENAVLAKTGKADPNIRQQVNQEYKDKSGVFGTERGGTMESILDPFGYNAPKEPIVDAKKENKRIKEALAKGEKVDSKSVVTKDPRKEKWTKKKDDEDNLPPAPVDTYDPDLDVSVDNLPVD